MKFKSATAMPHGGIEVHYEASHSTPGREGTTYAFDVTLKLLPNGTATVAVDMGTVEKPTAEEAIAKMSEWFQRAAEALKKKPTGNIPLFD